MKSSNNLRVRRSLHELQADYENGIKKPLEDLMRAWKGIKELPPDDPYSFFSIGGYHGEPFRGAGRTNGAFWGGYCNHANILFPTWHRVYLLKLEQALQRIPGCSEVMMPYWDETNAQSLTNGIPWCLTRKEFVLDGKAISNPLRSFVLPRALVDRLSPFPTADYSKPKGYETVRYPLSGLVGAKDIENTRAHNAKYQDDDRNVELLNQNIVGWLASTVTINGRSVGHVKDKYVACLDAPNYTVFSNATSARQWREDTGKLVYAVENPHDMIHMAIGGYDLPNLPDQDVSPISGANADMGENDTSSLDPIFFFHHCYIDRMFWLWQKRHAFTDRLEVIAEYPGTNSSDTDGGPTPGMVPNAWLTLETPLDPFKLGEGPSGLAFTSLDCVNIETQLGYTYGPGSLEEAARPARLFVALDASPPPEPRMIVVKGINRNRIRGSFLIEAFAEIEGKRQHIGTEGVLSRWHVEGCLNCQTHLEAGASISLHRLQPEQIETAAFEVQLRTRDGVRGQYPTASRALSATAAATEVGQQPNFTFVVR